MAQNVQYYIYYNGEIVKGRKEGSYGPSDLAYIPESTVTRDFNRLCLKIYENIGWPYTDILLIQGRFSYVKDGDGHFRLVKIVNDTQLASFAEHVRSVGGTGLEMYVDRIKNKESHIGTSFHIGTSSRSNVVVSEEINDDDNQFVRFDGARAGNNLLPELDTEHDEDEIDVEPEMDTDDKFDEVVYRQIEFNYIEDAEMISVWTFGEPLATEFENISTGKCASNEIFLGNSVSEKGDGILYKGQTFETKSELQSAVRLYSVLHHREVVVEVGPRENVSWCNLVLTKIIIIP